MKNKIISNEILKSESHVFGLTSSIVSVCIKRGTYVGDLLLSVKSLTLWNYRLESDLKRLI